MSEAEGFNADQRSFWDGAGGRTWVTRQAHTDRILEPVTRAMLALANPHSGERVLDVGCGCGAATLEFARAVGPEGKVTALDISGPMLEEARRRTAEAGIANVDWRQDDAATAQLDGFDLLVSIFGIMFFGDPVAAFTHLRRAAKPGARMAFVSWRPLTQNPWMAVPMAAVAPHIPPRPAGNPNAPGMFAFADPERVRGILTAAGWSEPEFEQLDLSLDIAAGRGLEEALVQTTQIGAINSWLRGQSEDVLAAATESLRAALSPYVDGQSVSLPGAMWMVRSSA